MSDKLRRGGLGTLDHPRPALIDRYVTAKGKVSGKTHVGLMVDGFCFQLCNYTGRHTVLKPVANREVECRQCNYIMRRDNISINTSVKFE